MTKRIASASSDDDQPTLNPNDQPQAKPHRAGVPSRRDFIKDCAAAAVGSGLAVASGAALATSSADAAPPTDDATVPLKKVIRRRRRSEEHTSELQSLTNLVCRLLL